MPAGELHSGEPIVREGGAAPATVAALRVVAGAADYYNLTVSVLHTYAVGDGYFVVHNTGPGGPICGSSKTPEQKFLSNQRRTGVKRAWRQEKQLVQETGEGTYPWTTAQKQELLANGSVKGFEGHHIFNVETFPDLADNPNNIAFVDGRADHLAMHMGDFANPSVGELIYRQTLIDMFRLGM